MKIFRFFIVFAFLFTIIVNFIFFAKTAAHFGGGMTYAITEAEREVYKDYFEKEPTDYDLNLKHPELLNKVLFIDWHENWMEKFKETSVHWASGDQFYFLTRKPEGKGIRLIKNRGDQTALLRSIHFFDAPPLMFRVMQLVQGLIPSDKDLQIYVYKVTLR